MARVDHYPLVSPSRVFQHAFIKGAQAWQVGEEKRHNPYHHPSYRHWWERGYVWAEEEQIPTQRPCPYHLQRCLKDLTNGSSCPVKKLDPLWYLGNVREATRTCEYRGIKLGEKDYLGYGLTHIPGDLVKEKTP